MTTATVGVKEAREKAVAAFKAFNAYCIEQKIEDANDIKAGKFTADVVQRFEGLEKEAWTADADFKKAEEHDTDGKRVMSARDRLSFYTKAVTGKEMGFQHVYSEPTRVSLGRAYVESEAYKDLLASRVLDGETGPSFMSRKVSMAASDIINTESGQPAEALVLPQYLPGILPMMQRPLTVRELFSQAPASSDLISYAQQTGFDSGADTVAQATSISTGAKPQSSIKWERKTSPIETIATYMVSTRQALADAGQVQSLIDNQGRLMLQLVEEDQILNGSGVSPDLTGLLNTAPVQTLDLTGATPADANNLDGIRVAKRMVKTGAARLDADGILIHPNDSEAIDLLKDSNGSYRGGNPIGNFTFNQPIWSLRRVESEAVAEGTAIVGAFKAGATVYERQPITVYTADQHSDFFIRNLIAVLFEERIGFPVFFPAGFVKITFATWSGTPSGSEGLVSG